MAYKQFSLDGIAGSVEFGKAGPRVKAETATKFGARNAVDNAYVDFQAANINGVNLVLSGDLTVNGSTTTIKSTTLTVQDKNIEIAVVDGGPSTDTTADGGGITLKGATDKTIIWDSANANWTLSENANLITGKTYKINNVDVLSSTTLGANVVNSSLTSVGTIVTGVWNGTTIAVADGGTGATSLTQYGLVAGNGTSPVSVISPVASTTKLLVSGGSAANPVWAWVGALYDTNGAKTVGTVGVASAADYLQVTNATGGGNSNPVVIEAVGTDANVSLLIKAKGTGSVLVSSPIDVTNSSIITTGNANIVLNAGTGTVTVPSGYEANVTANSLVNATYVSNFVANNASTARRAAIASGAASANLGAILPTPVSGDIYITRVALTVGTAFSGGSVATATVSDGTNTLMTIDENDILAAGTYVTVLPGMVGSKGAQLVVNFFQADGSTAATPTAGAAVAVAEYIAA